MPINPPLVNILATSKYRCGVLHLFVPHIRSCLCLPIVYRLDNGAGGV